MKKILVHLHVYYHDQVDYFIDKLKNITGVEYDLVVTYSETNKETIEKIRNFKPEAEFFSTENLGYDIWPFIRVIKSTNLSNYDFVVKLHTKRPVKKCTVNVIPLKGYEWRDALVDGILYSPDHFSKLIKMMGENKNIGMVSNLLTFSKRNWDSYSPGIKKEMDKLGLEIKSNYFCMGTMFIARADVLLPLQTDKITRETFLDTINDRERDFKSSHYYERLISVLPAALGKKHLALSPRRKDSLVIKLTRFFESPFRWIFCIEKKGPEKRKFMRIAGIEFFIEPEKHKS